MSYHGPIKAADRPSGNRMRIDFRTGQGDAWPFFVPVTLACCIGRYPRIEGIGTGGALIDFHATDA